MEVKNIYLFLYMCVCVSLRMEMHNGYKFTDASYDNIHEFAPARLEHAGVF